MAEKQKQHFVPKLYLRNFSSNGKIINSYLLDSENFIFDIGLEKQCQKKFFYGKTPEIENLLGILENGIPTVIKKMLIEKIRTKKLYLTFDEYLKFLQFVSVLHSRTLHMKDKTDKTLDTMMKQIAEHSIKHSSGIENKEEMMEALNSGRFKFENSFLLPLDVGLFCYHSLGDLFPVFLINNTDIDYITSDSPCIFYNSAFNHVQNVNYSAWTSPGLQIFLPLNSKICIMLFDTKYYDFDNVIKWKVQNPKWVRPLKCVIDSKEDIKSINKLQIYNSYKTIYFENKNQEESILEITREIKIQPVKPSTLVEHIAEEGNPLNTYMSITDYQIPYFIRLSFVKLLPIRWIVPKHRDERLYQKGIDYLDQIDYTTGEN